MSLMDIQEMKLDERYKVVTFETLNRQDFLESVKDAFPNVDWDNPYSKFKAAGQSENKGDPADVRRPTLVLGAGMVWC